MRKIVVIAAFLLIFVMFLGACSSGRNNSISRTATASIVELTVVNIQMGLTGTAISAASNPNTPQPSSTPEPSNTSRPSETSEPTGASCETEIETEIYEARGASANIRSCPEIGCDRIDTLSFAEDVEVVDRVAGDSMDGTNIWYRILLEDGSYGFVHSSDVTSTTEAGRTVIVTETCPSEQAIAFAPSATLGSSNVAKPSSTPEPTDTALPANTPRPAEVDTDTYYITGSTANVRDCATSTTSCSVITALSYGDDIEVIEAVEGVAVSGSTRWYHVLLNDGRDGYIHSSLVSRTRPVAGSSSGSTSGSSGGSTSGSSSGSSGGSTGSTNVQATAVPQVQPTQPPASGYTCDCNKTCGAMTCDEAYYQLNTCGCGARDNDNDGVPCESVCSGG